MVLYESYPTGEVDTDPSTADALTPITAAELNAGYPRCHPTEDRILFAPFDLDAYQGAEESQLYTIASDGSRLTQLTHVDYTTSRRRPGEATWTPDGKRIIADEMTSQLTSSDTSMLTTTIPKSHVPRTTCSRCRSTTPRVSTRDRSTNDPCRSMNSSADSSPRSTNCRSSQFQLTDVHTRSAIRRWRGPVQSPRSAPAAQRPASVGGRDELGEGVGGVAAAFVASSAARTKGKISVCTGILSGPL